MNEIHDCCPINERYVFALASGEQTALTEKQQIELADHLVECSACRNLFYGEDRLTELLSSAATAQPFGSQNIRRRQGSEVWKWAAALAATLLVTLTVLSLQKRSAEFPYANQSKASSSSSFGSIETRPIITNASYSSSSRQLQQNDNRVELPAGATAKIELTDCGTIDALGPVVLEIDRVDDTWKTTLLSGSVRVTVNEGQRIKITSQSGSAELQTGVFRVSSDGPVVKKSIQRVSRLQEAYIKAIVEQMYLRNAIEPKEPSEKQENKQAEKLQQEEQKQPTRAEVEAMAAFYDDAMSAFRSGENPKHDMKTTAELLRKVMEHPHATASQKYSARFYRCAALANSKQFAAALKLGEQMVAENPEQPEVIFHIMADSHYQLGETEKAKTIWNRMLKRNPDSPFKAAIQLKLGGAPQGNQPSGRQRTTIPPAAQPPYVSDSQSKKFNRKQSDGYLVVAVGLEKNNADHQKFLAVARQVEEFHKATFFRFEGTNFEVLKSQVTKVKPANVLFVIPPKKLDVDFHRQVFQLAPSLDNDLFADFSWGYLTAKNGDAVEKFWQRIKSLHQKGLSNQTWIETQVIGGDSKSYTTEGPNSIPEGATAAGFKGKSISFAQVTADPEVLDFVDRELPALNEASVIAMTGNGDPQSIWLFDDARNADPSQHWQFDPAKVGYDPNNELTRIKADRFRKLRLQSPIIWSGTCHSGACERVYVEGDIVSTFGTSDKTEAYDLDPSDSLALTFLDAGAGSMLVPIASNHGMSCSMETRFCFQHGATLGETIKSTYDDVYYQARGIPNLIIVSKETDEEKTIPSYYREPIMQSAGANRILIGDPSLRPFPKTEIPSESKSIEFDKANRSARVDLEWKKGFHPGAWNIFADGGGASQRIQARIDVPEDIAKDARNVSIDGKLTTANGKEISANFRVEIERSNGKVYWHLQADTEAQGLMHQYHKAVFQLSWK